MTSRYTVKLNNTSMASLDDDLLILNVQHDPPEYEMNTYQVANRNGAGIHRKTKKAARVTVSFEIHSYAIDDRQEILDDVIKWARNGGTLEVNDRDGLILDCICESYPSIESVRDWTSPLSITFAAYKVPYWQDKTASSVTVTGATASNSLAVKGTGGDAFVKCTIVPSGTLTSATVSAGNSSISLSGLSTNSSVTIGYDENMVFSILRGTTSLLDKRSAASSDDLRVPSGKTSTFSVTCNVSVAATFEVRGNWE